MQHLRSKNEVPMSVQNYDRHGIENLQHDPVKPLDRLKFPAWLVYTTIVLMVVYCAMYKELHEEMDIERMQRKNLLLAMKKTKEEVDMDKETSSAEEFEMKSAQFKKIVRDQQRLEKVNLDVIKS